MSVFVISCTHSTQSIGRWSLSRVKSQEITRHLTTLVKCTLAYRLKNISGRIQIRDVISL